MLYCIEKSSNKKSYFQLLQIALYIKSIVFTQKQGGQEAQMQQQTDDTGETEGLEDQSISLYLDGTKSRERERDQGHFDSLPDADGQIKLI